MGLVRQLKSILEKNFIPMLENIWKKKKKKSHVKLKKGNSNIYIELFSFENNSISAKLNKGN